MALSTRGYRIAMVAPGERFSDYEERLGDICIFRIKSLPLGNGHWRMATLASLSVERILESFRPDLVVISLPFLLNRTVASEAGRRSIPRVGILGTMPEWLLYNLGFLRPLGEMFYCKLWDIIADFYNQCDYVVTPSHTALAMVREHGLNRPAEIISNGVELDKFYPRPRDEELAHRLRLPSLPSVLYTGRLDAEKRMDIWIKAIPHVLKQMEAHFIIGGGGSEHDKLVDLVGQLGMASHVTFTGFLEAAEYQRLYSLADVFAIASPSELQSIVTLEAAASGLPIVAVNAGALPELVIAGRNGFLFPQEDSAAMAAAIVRILKDPELATRMGAESRGIAIQHDFTRSVQQYERLYKALIGGRTPVA